jgi:predicted dehydrogenase
MKAAVIGLGPHGRRVIDVLRVMPEIELAGAVDQDSRALEAAELPLATARCRSLDELWRRCEHIDLIYVATNGPSHASLAVAAMDKGARQVMVEKPMACSLAECDQIIAKATETGSRIGVGHLRRFAPAYRWLRERIASGDWGRPRCIWMQRPGIGLGCNATHSFDAVVFLLGRMPQSVTGWVDEPIGANPRGAQFVDPGGLVVIDFGGGVRGVVAQIEDGSGPTSVEIDMTAARIRLDERSGEIEVLERDLSVKPGPGRPPIFRKAELPEGMTAKPDMSTMIRGCLQDLMSGREMISGAEHGRLAVEVLIATHLSQKRGNVPVALPLRSDEETTLWLPVT